MDKLPRFNLNVILRETGVKADTLRAWERRYNLPRPERSEGGHRLFSQYDIETIKWLLARQEEGMSIGRAAALWQEIEAGGDDPLASGGAWMTQQPEVVELPNGSERLADIRGRWIRACMSFDEAAAEQVLGEAFALFAMETVCLDVLRAGLSEVGERWYMGEVTVQQEHFATELAMRRLHALMAAAPAPVHTQQLIVGCPPEERHTFPALFSTLMLRYRGWPVVYLGANVPVGDLRGAVETVRPELVVLSASSLVTAGSLLESGRVIRDMEANLAFGGGIFNRIPDLTTRIPGHYLGDSLGGSIVQIETLLGNEKHPKAPIIELPDHAILIEKLEEQFAFVEKEVLQTVREQYGAVISDRYFIDANTYIRQDIIAALKLGDIRLLAFNIEWLGGLLGRHPFHEEALRAYLQAYQGAVGEHVGGDAKLLIDFIGSILYGNKEERGKG